MLSNNKEKKENTKKKKKDELAVYEDNIQSMRNWVRKIEQTANSLSSRLAAVEKRISIDAGLNNNGFITVETEKCSILSKAFEDLQGCNGKDFDKLIKVIGSELSILHGDLASLQNEISLFNEKVDDINSRFSNIKEEIYKTLEYEEQVVNDVNERISRLENRAPPVMKLGGMEVPIEIAGVIAGGTALFAAVLVVFKQQSFLVSPGFLAFVGIVFIAAALLKTVKTSKAKKIVAPKTVFTVVKEQ
jgi:hypothetical protein